MIFPQNVYHSVSGSGGMTDADKNRFYAQMIVFFGSIFLLGACWICYKYLHISPWFAFLGGLVIVVLVGISFFRFVVFDEQSKIHEYKAQSSDNFAKYVQVRKGSTAVLEINGFKVPVFEFLSGNNFCVLQLRYGSNDTAKAKNTQFLMEQIFHSIAMHNLQFRTIETTENFLNSVELDRYSKRLNQVSDKRLAFHLMKTLKLVTGAVEDLNNTSTLFIMIQTQYNFQLPQLESCVKEIMSSVQGVRNAFRSVSFLNWNKLMEFYREFYSLEAIDLSTMRVMALAEENADALAFSDVVNVYQLLTDDNRVLKSNNDWDPSTGARVIR